MAGPSSASEPKPSTNSDWMRSTRHGSVCTQSVGPRESSRRWSVVLPAVTWPRRSISRPLTRRSRVVAHARSPVSQSFRVRSQRSMCSVGHVLVLLVREHRVAGTEVDRRDAERGELRDVGPAELRVDLAADGLDERLRGRAVEPGQRTRGDVGHRDVVPLEEVADERLGVGLAAVGGEAEVDLDDALVGDHVAGDAAADAGRVEALVVGQAVDLGLVGDVVVEPGEHRTGEVDGVDALPAARAVRPLAGGAYVDAHRALAARLDGGVARLHQDREVGLEQLGVALGELAQPVVDRVDLLGLVEHEGEVAVGLGDVGGELEHDRVAALHVAAAEAVEDAVLEARGQVVVERDRVEVAGDDDALGAAEVGARDERVAATGEGQVRQREQGLLDRVGDLLLLVADGEDVDELLGEGDDVGGQVEMAMASIQPAARSLRHRVWRAGADRPFRCTGERHGTTHHGDWPCS